MSYSTPVCAEAVARKIRTVKLDHGGFVARGWQQNPRILEAMLFLQWQSWQPGGLDAFSTHLINTYPQHFGVAEMSARPALETDGTLEEILPVWRAFRHACRSLFLLDGFRAWLDLAVPADVSAEDLKKYHARELREGLSKYNFDFLRKACLRQAGFDLPRLLHALCAHDDFNAPPFWFAGMFPALFAAMDAHAAAIEGAVGKTVVKEKIFQRLAFAAEETFPVVILGDARLGKTTCQAAHSRMRPGLRRQVTIPSSNTLFDFLIALADAMGIVYDPGISVRALKWKVEFTLAHCRFFLAFDEFQYALPTRYSRKTASKPHRLNWIRENVVDKGLPCAFFATRQTYQTTEKDFVEATRYNLEQWLGRVAPPLLLDPVVVKDDLLLIGRSKYADVPGWLLKLVAAWCVKLAESQARPDQPIITAAQRHLIPVLANPASSPSKPVKPSICSTRRNHGGT